MITKSSKKGSKREEERKVKISMKKGMYVIDKIMKKFSQKCNEDIVGPFKNIQGKSVGQIAIQEHKVQRSQVESKGRDWLTRSGDRIWRKRRRKSRQTSLQLTTFEAYTAQASSLPVFQLTRGIGELTLYNYVIFITIQGGFPIFGADPFFCF